jgi:hypothetical protein
MDVVDGKYMKIRLDFDNEDEQGPCHENDRGGYDIYCEISDC